jgi:hypothetical protein
MFSKLSYVTKSAQRLKQARIENLPNPEIQRLPIGPNMRGFWDITLDWMKTNPFTAAGLGLGVLWFLLELARAFEKHPVTGKRRGLSLAGLLGPLATAGLGFGADILADKLLKEPAQPAYIMPQTSSR